MKTNKSKSMNQATNIHNSLINYYRQAKITKNKKSIQKQSIVGQAYKKKIAQVDVMSPVEDFIRNQEHIAAQSQPLDFRQLPRKLKVHFPGPPSPPPLLQQIPYTYQIVQKVPFKIPKQKPGFVGDWVLNESHFVHPTHKSSFQQTSKQKYSRKDINDRNQRFRTVIKKVVKIMKEQNLSLKQIIKNKGFIKKSHNYYNSIQFFQMIKKGDPQVQKLLELNPYLAYDIDDQKMTALHWTARQGHVYITKLLLQKYRANPSAKDVYGRTPLHLAILKKNHECLKRIFIQGGSLVTMNNDGKSARQIASDNYTKYLLQKLEEARFITKSRFGKQPKRYRQQLQKTIKNHLDESSLYF